MKKLSLSFIWVFAFWVQFTQADITLKPGYPKEYTVQEGDTLWDIAGMYLDKPWLWPKLWEQNPQIKDPHLIYPGDVLVIQMINGQPTLQKAVSAELRHNAIPAIRYDRLKAFLQNIHVLTQEEFDAAPYVLSGEENRTIAGKGDRIYIKGLLNTEAKYQICREGEHYIDPVTQEALGFEAIVVGDSHVERQAGEVTTVRISRSQKEIVVGDRVFASDQTEMPVFQPNKPTVQDGQIIAVLDGVVEVGQFNIVVINRGSREGVDLGNVFTIHKKTDPAKDPTNQTLVELPSDVAGQLIIFKVSEKLSYGLVLSASRPLAVMDDIRQPL